VKIGFLGLLTILFVGLKLANVIAWSWWFVLLPLYGGLAILAILMIIIGVIGMCYGKLPN
jgi:hypothetical protein